MLERLLELTQQTARKINTAGHLSRRAGGALGKTTHLLSHHGEASAGLSGPGRLDGRIQRQQIGLAGDALDGGCQSTDLLARLIDLAHLVVHLATQGDTGSHIAEEGGVMDFRTQPDPVCYEIAGIYRFV